MRIKAIMITSVLLLASLGGFLLYDTGMNASEVEVASISAADDVDTKESVVMMEADYLIRRFIRESERYLITGDDKLYGQVVDMLDEIGSNEALTQVYEDGLLDEGLVKLKNVLADVRKMYEILDHNRFSANRFGTDLITYSHDYIGRQLYIMGDASDDKVKILRNRILIGDRIANEVSEIHQLALNSQIQASVSDIESLLPRLEDLEKQMEDHMRDNPDDVDVQSLEAMKDFSVKYRSGLESVNAAWNTLGSQCLNTRELLEAFERDFLAKVKQLTHN